MRKQDVYAELSSIVAGYRPGRTSDDEITIFDSTGVAIAAVAVYEKSCSNTQFRRFDFGV